MTTLGVIFPPDLPPEQLRKVARTADDGGLSQLWLWEDCFAESGIAAAAATLGWTERVSVGIGLLPVPLRNVALTAMELATLERLFPGRVVPGVGHGVLEWMGQVGQRVDSPMTLLREYTAALRRLLHGETVTLHGHYVHLDAVRLAWPPSPPPPLLVGAVKPRTLALAGELADGVILTGETTPDQLRQAVKAFAAGRHSPATGGDSDTPATGGDSDTPATGGDSDTPATGGDSDTVVFVPVDAGHGATAIASRIDEFATAGATTVALLSVGDEAPNLVDFVRFVVDEVTPALETAATLRKRLSEAP